MTQLTDVSPLNAQFLRKNFVLRQGAYVASVDPDLCVDLLMQIVRQFWKQHVIARHRRKKRPIVLS